MSILSLFHSHQPQLLRQWNKKRSSASRVSRGRIIAKGSDLSFIREFEFFVQNNKTSTPSKQGRSLGLCDQRLDVGFQAARVVEKRGGTSNDFF